MGRTKGRLGKNQERTRKGLRADLRRTKGGPREDQRRTNRGPEMDHERTRKRPEKDWELIGKVQERTRNERASKKTRKEGLIGHWKKQERARNGPGKARERPWKHFGSTKKGPGND